MIFIFFLCPSYAICKKKIFEISENSSLHQAGWVSGLARGLPGRVPAVGTKEEQQSKATHQ